MGGALDRILLDLILHGFNNAAIERSTDNARSIFSVSTLSDSPFARYCALVGYFLVDLSASRDDLDGIVATALGSFV